MAEPTAADGKVVSSCNTVTAVPALCSTTKSHNLILMVTLQNPESVSDVAYIGREACISLFIFSSLFPLKREMKINTHGCTFVTVGEKTKQPPPSLA